MKTTCHFALRTLQTDRAAPWALVCIWNNGSIQAATHRIPPMLALLFTPL